LKEVIIFLQNGKEFGERPKYSVERSHSATIFFTMLAEEGPIRGMF